MGPTRETLRSHTTLLSQPIRHLIPPKHHPENPSGHISAEARSEVSLSLPAGRSPTGRRLRAAGVEGLWVRGRQRSRWLPSSVLLLVVVCVVDGAHRLAGRRNAGLAPSRRPHSIRRRAASWISNLAGPSQPGVPAGRGSGGGPAVAPLTFIDCSGPGGGRPHRLLCAGCSSWDWGRSG